MMTAILGFVALVLALLGGVALAIVRMIKGPRARKQDQSSQEEARLIQDLHQGLTRMEQRIEALETILLEKDKKGQQS
ncbi:MAG: phage-shock protein [Desulfarculus sp.]|jgi:phage shock protein B|nr:MAG: phage-shock protein [Desulfarculus sp.]